MQNRKLEGRVKWHNRKWDVMFSIQKLWLQSGSILSHPVIPSFKTVYKPKAAFEIYLEAFDFFHLDTWRINRFETTDLYYQIAREWHQAGYILLGFKWSY
ncbi:MAG: hypothetical protein GXO24_02780 [Chlorobi bacterium]|nr:hypothetical protein [Chlorobiota bacterium]